MRQPDHKSASPDGVDGNDSEYAAVTGIVAIVAHHKEMVRWNHDFPVALESFERIILEDLVGPFKGLAIQVELC